MYIYIIYSRTFKLGDLNYASVERKNSLHEERLNIITNQCLLRSWPYIFLVASLCIQWLGVSGWLEILNYPNPHKLMLIELLIKMD